MKNTTMLNLFMMSSSECKKGNSLVLMSNGMLLWMDKSDVPYTDEDLTKTPFYKTKMQRSIKIIKTLLDTYKEKGMTKGFEPLYQELYGYLCNMRNLVAVLPYTFAESLKLIELATNTHYMLEDFFESYSERSKIKWYFRVTHIYGDTDIPVGLRVGLSYMFADKITGKTKDDLGRQTLYTLHTPDTRFVLRKTKRGFKGSDHWALQWEGRMDRGANSPLVCFPVHITNREKYEMFTVDAWQTYSLGYAETSAVFKDFVLDFNFDASNTIAPINEEKLMHIVKNYIQRFVLMTTI
jgi:hypothetical protein